MVVVIIMEVRTAEDMRALLTASGLELSQHYIVRPNWFFAGKGFYTDAKT